MLMLESGKLVQLWALCQIKAWGWQPQQQVKMGSMIRERDKESK